MHRLRDHHASLDIPPDAISIKFLVGYSQEEKSMIERPQYLKALRTYRDVPLVKILAGIRRCGKSTILEMLRADLLKDGIRVDHVIFMRYTSEELDEDLTAKDMYKGIKARMTDGGRCYLLLNEVQEIDGWEKAVNSPS